MNNKFLYAKNISLENILKLLFNKPEIEHSTKLNLLLQFETTEHINQQTFDEYFFYNFNRFDRCFVFNSSSDEQLALAFKYNKENQKFEMAISTNKDIENRREELFDKLSYELQNPKYHYLYKVSTGYYVSDCERLKILQYLKDMAEMEYNDGFITFYPELIDIQALIIETFELNCVKGNSLELFSNLCKGVL